VNGEEMCAGFIHTTDDKVGSYMALVPKAGEASQYGKMEKGDGISYLYKYCFNIVIAVTT
jgi:hypothetical protein